MALIEESIANTAEGWQNVDQVSESPQALAGSAAASEEMSSQTEIMARISRDLGEMVDSKARQRGE